MNLRQKIITVGLLIPTLILAGSGLYNSARKIISTNSQPQIRALIFLEQPEKRDENIQNNPNPEYQNPTNNHTPNISNNIKTNFPSIKQDEQEPRKQDEYRVREYQTIPAYKKLLS